MFDKGDAHIKVVLRPWLHVYASKTFNKILDIPGTLQGDSILQYIDIGKQKINGPHKKRSRGPIFHKFFCLGDWYDITCSGQHTRNAQLTSNTS